MTSARLAGAVIVAVAAIALLWGWSVGREPAPPRPADLVARVDAAWYDALPLDPAAATAAYLARIPPDMRARGKAYSDTRLIAFALRVITLIAATAFLCATAFGARVRDAAGAAFRRQPVIDAAVALAYFIALYALSLPAEVYASFVRPHRFGFSAQSFAGWLADDLTNFGVFTTFYVVGMLAIYGIMRRRPRTWALWAIVVYLVLRTLYAVLSPGVIEPLTNDFRPLPDGAQKDQVLALARANGIEDASVVTSDASRRSRLLNAHVSGFGATARISLDDTTLRATSDPMLRMVVAHEIGHFVMHHDIAAVVSDTLVTAVGFLAIAWALRVLVRRYGARFGVRGEGDIASLPLFWGLFALWGFIAVPATNAISRVYERQADLYGLNASRAPHGMAEFMIHDADTARLAPSALEYALFYDHPSDAERVMTAMRWRASEAALQPP
ncbi:MAG TPA: M48 family metalloprotease [Casimicrobiaceae bacterium]